MLLTTAKSQTRTWPTLLLLGGNSARPTKLLPAHAPKPTGSERKWGSQTCIFPLARSYDTHQERRRLLLKWTRRTPKEGRAVQPILIPVERTLPGKYHFRRKGVYVIFTQLWPIKYKYTSFRELTSKQDNGATGTD